MMLECSLRDRVSMTHFSLQHRATNESKDFKFQHLICGHMLGNNYEDKNRVIPFKEHRSRLDKLCFIFLLVNISWH